MNFLSSELDLSSVQAELLCRNKPLQGSKLGHEEDLILSREMPLSPPPSSPTFRRHTTHLGSPLQQTPCDHPSRRTLRFEEGTSSIVQEDDEQELESQEEEVSSDLRKLNPLISLAKKRRKRKEPKIVFWKLTTLASPNFDPARLTSRQQMALIQKKEELQASSCDKKEVNLMDVAKLCSPFVMDKQDDFYSHWTQEMDFRPKSPSSLTADFYSKRSTLGMPSKKTPTKAADIQWLTKKKHLTVAYNHRKKSTHQTKIIESAFEPMSEPSFHREFENEIEPEKSVDHDDRLYTLSLLATEQPKIPIVPEEPRNFLPRYPLSTYMASFDNEFLHNSSQVHSSRNSSQLRCGSTPSEVYHLNTSAKILEMYQHIELDRWMNFEFQLFNVNGCCPKPQSNADWQELVENEELLKKGCSHFISKARAWKNLLFRQSLERQSLEFSR